MRHATKGKRTVWEGINLGVCRGVAVDAAETGKGVLPVNVHGTRAADTLSARAPESESGIDLVLDLDERIQDLCARTLARRGVAVVWRRAMGPVWLRSMV